MDWYMKGVEEIDTPIEYPVFDGRDLPPGLIIATYVFTALVLVTHASLGVWVYKKRDHPVMKFAQPSFLIIILVGASFGLSALIPFANMHISVSDEEAYNLGEEGIQALSSRSADAACQSLGWLLIT